MAVYTAASPNIESYFLNTLLFKHVNTSWCIIQRVDTLSTLSVPELFDACIVVHVTVYTVFEMKYKTRFRQLLRGCANQHGASHNISMECEKKLA